MMRPADNPFAMQRIDAIPYEMRGMSWDDLLARLERLGRRSAIVGPHGTGKSTLMEALAARLEARAWQVRYHRLRRDDRAVPSSFLAQLGPTTMLMLDSAGCLGPGAWLDVARRSRSSGALIITAHRPGRLPTLLRTRIDASLMTRLVEALLGGSSPWPPAELEAMLRAHRGNARQVLRELYDRIAASALREV